MFKSIVTCFFLLVCLCRVAGQTGEDSLSLNGDWLFKTDPYGTGETKNWYQPAADSSGWEVMPVPSNWDTRNEYAHYTGKAWYRKSMKVPAEWKGKAVRLFFEAVYHDSKIWLNNQLLGSNNSGFLPFEFQVSQLINYGGENTVVVCADNSFRRGAIWNWGGIRRPVLLLANNPVRILSQKVVPQLNVAKGTSELRVQAAVRNEKSVAAEVTGEILVSASNGFRRSLPFTVSVPPDSMKVVSVQTKLGRKDTHPWHFDDPFLYTSQVTIREKGEVLHQVSDFFGFRKLEVDNKTYSLKLNNEVIRVMGFNLVPDDRTTGNTLPAWRVKEDIDLIKSFGANMSRLTHLPLHKEMLDYLDQKGIMIYAEIPLWGFDQLADKKNPVPKEWLKRLITDNFNHPCIIGWGVGNEIGDYPQVMEYVEDAIRYVRSLDTTRMAVMVSHTAHRNPDPIQYSDLGLINRYGTAIGRLADSIHLHHPEKTLFYAEYGYNQFSEDLNASFDVKGMVDSLRFKPYLVGGSLWTFNDYRSSYPATKEVSENRAWGIVDVFRQKKRAYHALKKEYSPVREFIIQNLDTGLRTASLLIKPRKLLDLPAYILKDYLVTWKAMDQQEKVIRCGSTRLPLIRPGDPDITKSINWKGPENIMSLQVHLVSPLHYSVYDTTIYFGKPQFPEINYAVGFRTEMNNLSANRGSIRVGFGRAAGATAYKLKYGKHDLSQETLPTINQYIDLPGLAFNDSFQVSAVAINTVGESASPVQTVQVGTGSAPTLIYYTEPADKGFFVGYVSSPEDYLYKVQYSTVAGSFENASLMQSGTKGVLFVPGLENGRQYFFRVRTVKHNMYEGPWSETRSVIPDGGMKPPVPLLQGVVFDGNEAVIFFKPVKKSTGYLLQFRTRDTDEWVTQEVNASQVEHIRVRTTVKNKPQEFRMASVNAYGQSPFSDVMTAEKSM